MARYFKVNPKVALYLGVEDKRNVLKDGNYLLWQADLRAFGSLVEYKSICERIGAIALLPYEARQEQDGVLTRPLPIATDPQFVVENNTISSTQTEVEQPETTDETDAESETETDDTPEPQSDPTDEATTSDQPQSEETENTNLSEEEQ